VNTFPQDSRVPNPLDIFPSTNPLCSQSVGSNSLDSTRPTPPTPPTVTVTHPGEAGNASAEWEAFVQRSDVTCGFWCDPLVATRTVAAKELVLVTVRDESAPRAMLPFRLADTPVALSVGLLRLGAVRTRMAKLLDGAFAASAGYARDRLLAAAVSQLRAEKTCDLVMADNWPLPGNSRLPPGTVPRHRQTTYLIDMPDDFEAYLGRLSSNTRQTLRRKTRRLGREAGCAIRARCYRDPDEMPELHEQLRHVWQRSWHGRLNRQPPPAPEFLRDMAAHGWVRSYILFAGERPIAAVQGYQYKGTFMDEAPAFDDKWKPHSPGLVLNYLVLQDLFATDPPETVDFGFGYNQYKETLGTRPDPRAQPWIPLTPRGRLTLAALQCCDAIFQCGKRTLGRTGAIRTLKSKKRSS